MMRASSITLLFNRYTIQKLCRSYTSLAPAASPVQEKKTWDLVSAVCLERRPVISRDPTELEKKILKLFKDKECKNSYKSDHEIRLELEREKQEKLKKGDVDVDVEHTMIQTVQDEEDAYAEEFAKFSCTSRITKADEENDARSLDRMLDRHLILVVHQKLGSNHEWILPQGLRQDGETMRQAAERVLQERCGTDIKTQFLSNAPCGFYKFKYPKDIRSNGPIGAKIFFFKAWHVCGQVECDKSLISDYRWYNRQELDKNLHREYYKSVDKFLIDEDY